MDDLEWTELERGETAFRRKQFGEAAEATDSAVAATTCRPAAVPGPTTTTPQPRRRWTCSRAATRFGSTARRARGEGDYVSPATGEAGAHRVINDSRAPLRYLAVSAMTEPDVTVYPDADRSGVFVGSSPGGRDERPLEKFYEIDGEVSYRDE